MKKKILITGGTGFLGSNISRYLINLGHKVTIFDNNFRGKKSRIKDISKKILHLQNEAYPLESG